MKNSYFTLFAVLTSLTALSQPSIEWKKNFGGSHGDNLAAVIETKDGGYLAVGSTFSKDGDAASNNGEWDVLVVKLDKKGNVEWKNCYGGPDDEKARAVVQAPDGSYAIAGIKWQRADKWDAYLLKLSGDGKTFQEFIFGGEMEDEIFSIDVMKDGSYVLAGFTHSNDRDVSQNHDWQKYAAKREIVADYWVIKVDSEGNKKWSKCYGGSGNDYAASVSSTSDGGCIVVGRSRSNDFQVTNNTVFNGNPVSSCWLVKLDNDGVVQNSNVLGQYVPHSIKQIKGGGYIIAASARSKPDQWGNPGKNNFHIIKTDDKLVVSWELPFGGNFEDNPNSVFQCIDGGFIVAGTTASTDGHIKENKGKYDLILLKVDDSGNVVFNKTYGGSLEDYGFSAQQTKDGGYIIGGSSYSSDGDVPDNKGKEDFWVIKLLPDGKPVQPIKK